MLSLRQLDQDTAEQCDTGRFWFQVDSVYLAPHDTAGLQGWPSTSSASLQWLGRADD